ncbi:MAG: helix-turn-helix transcriptional regulator [Pseudomonadota bacterium]
MSDEPLQPRIAKRVDEHVGERIRERRTLLGLTQEQLAAALGISYQQVQKYETGSNRVSAGRLFEISNVLGLEVGFFFDGLKPAAERHELAHGGRNRILIELVRNFSEISDPIVRSAVSQLVKSLTDRDARPETIAEAAERLAERAPVAADQNGNGLRLQSPVPGAAGEAKIQNGSGTSDHD